MVRFSRRPAVTAVLGAVLLLAAAISFRSLSDTDASATALPGACENLAFVMSDPNALADEAFFLRPPEGDAVARLEAAC